jgi:hypothetical protein
MASIIPDMISKEYESLDEFLAESAQTASQLVNSEPIPIPYLISPIILRGNYHLLTGPIGNMKSYFSLWLGSKLAEAGQKVLFVDKENSLVMIQARARSMGLVDSDKLIYWCERPGENETAPPDFKQGLKLYHKIVETWDNPVIIFDTLNRFAPGLDENSVKDTTFITDSLMSLRNKGATIIALHQVGKPSEGAYQHYRGSSEIGGGSDIGLTIRGFTRNSQGAYFTLNCFKTRWLPFSDLHIVFDTGQFYILPSAIEPKQFFKLRTDITKYLNISPKVGRDEIVGVLNSKKFGHHKADAVKWMLANCKKNHWLELEEGGNSFVYKNIPLM